jgi:hypothetical protein
LQKYDSRIVYLRRGGQARASRLTSDDRRCPAPPALGTLTPPVVQNISSIDGLGFHRVNFASAAFSREHLLIRPGAHTSNLRRHAKMLDLTVNGDLFVDGLVLKPPFLRWNRIVSPAARIPQFNHPTASRRALRGRKE